MSEFLAEAQVLITPNLTRFRTELEAGLNAAVRQVGTVNVPIAASVLGGAAAAARATSGLIVEQQAATATTLGLANAAAVESSAFGKQATILHGTTTATLELAGAQATLDASAKKSTASLLGAGSATAKLDAALLGLRTAVGSTAVIGLGALALAAIAAGQALRASITNFIDFQRQLSTFRVTAGATAPELEEVRQAAIRLGEDTRLPAVSATDAAQAMTELAKAGLSVQDSIAGAEGVLQLATAAQIDNAAAAQLAASALNAFGLAGDQASRVADDFANAANAAQGSISDVGLALQQSAAVARQVGLSLEDTTAILSLFAKNGLQGSDAGTSLRVALIRLVAPSKAAAAEIQKLGLEIRDAQGNVRPDVFAQFGEATARLSPAARDAAAALIFGQDAIRAVAIGAREGTDGLRLMQFQIDQTGTAAEVAAARTEGLGGSFSSLASGLETLSINFGKLVSVGLKPYLDVAGDVVTVTNKIAAGLDDLATAAANANTPLGKVKDRFVDLVSVGVPIIGEVRLLKLGLDRLGVGSDKNAEKIRELQDELKALQAARIAAEQGGQPQIADQLTRQIKDLRAEIDGLKREGEDIPDSLTDHLREAVTQLEKVRDVRISLGVDTSGIDRLLARLKEQIPITQQTEGNIQRLRDDIQALGQDSSGAAGGVQTLAQALAGLSRQSAQAQADLLRLRTEGGTSGQQIGALQADIDAQRKIIAAARARGGSGAATAIKQARLQILQDQTQIDSLISQQQSAAKTAQDRAQRARDAQDEALLTLLGNRREDVQRRASAAGQTAGLQDDIQAQNRLQALIKAQIEKIRDRIKDEDARRSAIRELRIALIASRAEEEKLREEQKTQAREAANEILDIKIQIAETRGQERLEAQLLKQKIVRLKKQIAAAKGEKLLQAQLRLELAETQKQLEDLLKQQENTNKTGKTLAQQQFEFLQSQQGFAANLLGNLIPGFATAGLVGNVSPDSTAARASEAARADLQTSSEIGAARGATVRPVQVDTTNALLRQILAALRGRHTAPPEISFNHRASGASVDTL